MRHARYDVIRNYYTVRSVHLERATAFAPATVLYAHQNYDFDPALSDRLDLIGGPLWRRLGVLAASGPRVLEINEPLMRPGILQTAAAVAIVRAAGRLRRRRTTIVTYAIENLDPFRRAPAGWKARARYRLEHRAAHYIARRVDKVAFGTPAAESLYREATNMSARTKLVLALPAPCACLDESVDTRRAGPATRLVFVGEFSTRKGVPQVLAAWPLVHNRRPQAQLTMIGTGPMIDDVQRAAADDESMSIVVSPPRSEIHAQLRDADALVLLSQRTVTWREQIGLPIVEGLAHGCRVIATTETGLADWLRTHDHIVLAPDATPDQVAAAIADSLDQAPCSRPATVDLAVVDGREQADSWLTE